MTDLPPADILRRAAAKLRERAQGAVHEDRTTWSTGNTLGSKSPVVVDHPEQPSVLIETYAARLEAVNRYIALIGPATGLALADWLEYTAQFADLYTDLSRASGVEPAEQDHDKTVQHALAVADAILGEPS